jgi:signal peptidase I
MIGTYVLTTNGTLVILVATAVPMGALTVIGVRRGWRVVRVRGQSMLPTLQDGETVLVRRRPGDAVRVNDIVVCRRPATLRLTATRQIMGTEPSGWIVKRVGAVPGDPVPDVVTIRFPESHIVPARTIIVLSDGDGLDSRTFGPMPYERILGVVVRSLNTASRVGHDPAIDEDPSSQLGRHVRTHEECRSGQSNTK